MGTRARGKPGQEAPNHERGDVGPDVARLKEVIALCQASGVTHVKIGDIELEFSTGGKPDAPLDPKAMAAIGKALSAEGYTDEEILFYSAGQPRPEKDLKES